MKAFDWLRLGGIIANEWPEIDFTEVAIVGVKCIGVMRVPLFEIGDLADEAEFEYEGIEMEKAIIEGHAVRFGYGPKSKQLMVNSTFLSPKDS